MPVHQRPFLLPVFYMLAWGTGVHAQELPDTVHLAPATIVGTRTTEFVSGIKEQTVDSAALARYRSANLGDLLGGETPIFIKSYGQGSLATTAFRGGSAGQTAILWNGFNIGSPMNGQLNLSLVPLVVADRVRIQYGGTSALWGSGALGGTVLLDNVAVFGKGLDVQAGASIGSFGDARQDVSMAYSTARWVSSVKVFNAAARNDFEYTNTEVLGAPLQTQRNADLQQFGLLAENHFRINSRQQINLRIWYQASDRGIPPTLLQENTSARQQDESWRFTSEWQRTGDKVQWNVRAAYFDEQLDWFSFSSAPGDLSHSRNLITEAEGKVALKPGHALNVGVNNTYSQAVSEGYNGRQQQDRQALFASYQLNTKDGRSRNTFSARQELEEGIAVPFTFSVGSEYGMSQGVTAKANVAKVYRVPTFNDLYWNPGGNPALLPESGYSADIGLAAKWTPAKSRTTLTGELSVFGRNVDNWIIWLPGPSYWSPRNIANVWSRGIETRGKMASRIGNVNLALGLLTSYVLSTSEEAKVENDASVGKQLIYVPLYSGQTDLTFTYKRLSGRYAMHYTGVRFTSTDNREFLEPFTLADASLTYAMRGGKSWRMEWLAQGFNLFAEQYEAVQNRPMPLRHYMLGVRVLFNQPLTSVPLQ
ncbi:MAG: TonB-dependent receptor plug domain-containing protein [Flavobacteriales bacterium]